MKRTRTVGTVLAAASATTLLVLFVGTSLVYRSPTESCFYAERPPGALLSEAANPIGELLWLPLGVSCTYPSESGGTITVGPDPTLTVVATALLVVCLAGFTLLAASRRFGNGRVGPVELRELV